MQLTKIKDKAIELEQSFGFSSLELGWNRRNMLLQSDRWRTAPSCKQCCGDMFV